MKKGALGILLVWFVMVEPIHPDPELIEIFFQDLTGVIRQS